MPLPDGEHGTPPRRGRNADRGDIKNIPANKGKGGASQPNTGGKGNRGPKTPNPEIVPLNPPFDPRMRRIGSPLNLTNQIKRGWIQSEKDATRVNFLYNPSELDLTHSIDPGLARNPAQAQTADVLTIDYPAMGSTTGVKLLYDRTYELFSAPKGGEMGFANKYGVWADVAAWYVFLGLLPEMPTSWDNSIISGVPYYQTSYLFVGPKMAFYGWVNGINVTYSHWNQQMVPARCAVDVQFTILPHKGKGTPIRGGKLEDRVQGGWVDDWIGNLGIEGP